MRSFVFFSTFVLSFALFGLVTARVPNQQKRAEQNTSPNGVVNFVRDLFGLTARQEMVCYEDDVWQEVHDYANSNEFCNRFLGLSPNIVAVYTTPVEYVFFLLVLVAILTCPELSSIPIPPLPLPRLTRFAPLLSLRTLSLPLLKPSAASAKTDSTLEQWLVSSELLKQVARPLPTLLSWPLSPVPALVCTPLPQPPL